MNFLTKLISGHCKGYSEQWDNATGLCQVLTTLVLFNGICNIYKI